MAKAKTTTVDEYLASLPEDRRAVIEAVHGVIRKRVPEGYRESVNWGMIAYEIPLERYPETYNGQPLLYAALAAQKNHYAVYLNGTAMSADRQARFRMAYLKTGKRLDMGKSCVRFKKLDDLPLGVIGDEVASTTPEALIAQYERSRAGAR
jgi:uncharacterized protein YdhG (YjbR/CyaY superfamily)